MKQLTIAVVLMALTLVCHASPLLKKIRKKRYSVPCDIPLTCTECSNANNMGGCDAEGASVYNPQVQCKSGCYISKMGMEIKRGCLDSKMNDGMGMVPLMPVGGTMCMKGGGGVFCVCTEDRCNQASIENLLGLKAMNTSSPCASMPCLNGGHCSETNTMYSYGSTNTYHCTCLPGFSGARCETKTYPTQPCEPHPCMNGGFCRDIMYMYPADSGIMPPDGEYFHCDCMSGYYGKRCENKTTVIDMCASNPCMNGASCENLGTYFMCHCQAGYSGHLCEMNLNTPNPCEPNQCMNGGFCRDLTYMYSPTTGMLPPDGEYFHCDCMPGFSGKRCEDQTMFKDMCASNPCMNGASCENMGTYFQCHCQAGYSGHLCEMGGTNTNTACASQPCQNGASCEDFGTWFMCHCKAGYHGQLCEIEADPTLIGDNNQVCLSEPCKNGASCQGFGTWFTCLCRDGFEGQYCEIPITNVAPALPTDWPTGTTTNACAINPCSNGGVCKEDPNMAIGYICECLTNSWGMHCEYQFTDVNPCDSNPCQNGASCSAAPNMYLCFCTTEYYGQNCEIKRII